MAAYVLVAKVDVIHLLTAVIMTAPGAIMMAKMIVPETEKPKTGADVEVIVPKQDVNVIDAAGRGAIEGLHLSLNVAGMLIAFIALVALINGVFGYAHGPQRIRGIRQTRPTGHRIESRSTQLRHRHLRSVRLRELLVHCHPDRRHRLAGAVTQRRSCKAGFACDAGRNVSELPDCDD